MRIALVTDYYLPTLGGTQTVVKAHREALQAAGHEVTIFTPLRDRSTDPNIVRLPVARWIAPDGYPFTWPMRRAADLMRREFAARGVDVVHTHSEAFAVLGGIRAAHELGLPIVHTMHGRIDVYTRNVLPVPAITTAFLAWLHGRVLPHDARITAGTYYTRTRTARRMWRLMVSQANDAAHMIVPSAHFAQKLIAQGVTTPVTVISNGLEASVLERIGPPDTRQPRASVESLQVMWCGRVSPEKRPEVLLEAVAQTPGVVAHLYGDGGMRTKLKARTRALGIEDRVILHGSVPQSEVLDAMGRHDLMVSSSFDFDNQPMVLLEATATGLPVVYADPDLAEMLPDDGALLTPSPDAGGLAATLARLRDDRALLGRLTDATAAHARTAAQSEHLDALVRVYRAAVAAPHA